MKLISILIAEDHALLRDIWKQLFENDPRFSTVLTAGTGEEAISLVRQYQPSIVLMDINLPGMNGIEATETIGNSFPQTSVIGVSLHNSPIYARRMMQKGAKGYVTKNAHRNELLQAIMEVSEGRKFICQEIKDHLSNELLTDEENKKESLSPREYEVIEQLKKGNSSKEIAETLQISVKTVEVHRYNILRKLNLRNTAALVNYVNHYSIN
jgi:DNA-binding NarL/FixJ family response regulator